jgi:hypothetical protein
MTDSLLPDEGEHLTTGWEPDAPADDTLVRQAVLAHASWTTTLARTAGKPWRRTDTWAGGRVGDRGAMMNQVVLTQPPHVLADVLAQANGLFPPEVPYLLVSPWPTGDLGRRGLALVGHPPLMVRLPGAESASPRSTVQVRRVLDDAELAVAEQVLVEGYPLPEMQPLRAGDLYAPALLDGSTRVWLAWDGDTPVGTSTAHVHAGVVLVEMVAALGSARGRGVGAAVAAAATGTEPGLPAVLLASDHGRPVYERSGYVAVERWTVWLRPAGR